MAPISYTITLGALSFTQSSTSYQVPNQPVEIGVSRRRVTVTAPHVPGELELASVAGAATVALTVRCYGGGSNPQTLVDAIVSAVTAETWNLTITWDGATRTWAARAADWRAPIGGEEQQLAHRRDVYLTIPVNPYPS